MKMERPIFVNVIAILSILGFLFTTYDFFFVKLFSDIAFGQKGFAVFYLIINIIGMIFIYNFFMLNKSKSKLWLNINVVLIFLYTIAATWHDIGVRPSQKILPHIPLMPEIFIGIVSIIFVVIFWNIFRIYINKNQYFSN